MKSKGLGGYTVSLDNETWLFGGGYSLLNMSLRAVGGAVPSSGSDRFGEYNSITVRWANSTSKDLEPVWETQFRTYTEGWRGGGLAIFRQTFLCEFDPPSLGTEANQHAVLGGFPSFDTSQTNPNKPLNVLNYIGSQLQYSGFTRWGAGSRYRASADHGFPAVLYDKSRRSLVVSPFSSFHVGILSTLTDPSGLRLDAGLKSTLLNVPANYEFETVLVSGRGVNATMAAFGDALLSASGKERANPDDDFILSNLGYWTDNGAFYYHSHDGFDNAQDALLAVQADFKARNIPVRYYQWDDWWFYGNPWYYAALPDIFPSGLTSWLNAPLSLYAGEYNSNNAYGDRYRWVHSGTGRAVPVDPNFYLDLFANCTAVGMRMWEQDYLSSTNIGTNLTNSDVETGDLWFAQMDRAAAAYNVTTQLCMMNPSHALASTRMKTVTNGRASPDHVRIGPQRELMLGINSLLLAALGVWPSRDNVWTNCTEQADRDWGNETDPMTQTVLAVLAGGPYGPADQAGAANRSLLMQTCRDDGRLLKVDYPAVPLESTWTIAFDADAPVAVWAAMSFAAGPSPWAYVIAQNLESSYPVSPSDIGADAAQRYLSYEYYYGIQRSQVIPVSSAAPALLPACPQRDARTSGTVFWVFAPVLESGWAYLGETTKIVAASRTRIVQYTPNLDRGSSGGFEMRLNGAPKERIEIAVLAPPEVHRVFTSSAAPRIQLLNATFSDCSDADCSLTLRCVTADGKCSFT